MSSSTDTTSNTEFHGPGISETDPSVSQGTNDDEPSLPLETELVTAITAPLPVGGIECPVCARNNNHILFLDMTLFSRHISQQHPQTDTKWACRICGKLWERLHPWRCHFAKCKGKPAERQDGHKCDSCGMFFATGVGRSMHERHMHPEIRNAKRRMAAEAPRLPAGRSTTVWSDQEIVQLKELETLYSGARFINIEIQKHMTNKTTKQISDKRRGIRLLEARNNVAAGSITVETRPTHEIPIEEPDRQTQEEENINNGSDAVSSVEDTPVPQGNELLATGNTCNLPDKAPTNETGDAENSTYEGSNDASSEERSQWKDILSNCILEPPSGPELYKKLRLKLVEIWKDSREDSCSLGQRLDAFIATDLVPTLRCGAKDGEEGDNQAAPSSNRPTTSRRKGTRQKNNRNNRKRREYQKAQDLYEHCPKKLVEAVMNGDKTALGGRLEPPKKEDIIKLYNELWGIEGPAASECSRCGINETARAVSTSDVFTPVTTEEILAKIKKIRGNTATGQDGIRKRDLARQGVSALLATLFNILLREGHFPAPWLTNRTTLIPKLGKDEADAKNWRPITISSLLNRIFCSLIDKRLRAVIRQSVRQKGFTMENGCKANTALFKHAVTTMKAGTGGVAEAATKAC
ncbi:uncharacterized protein LOC107268173 [Cephus cinctus]|uniref:Uncharacterized protein LOC107268173 n=1 Tax=Cephus cinctus TaxID=211228 RepID=A0AAJ7BXR2_CEPCN|nr:uncharacterized protein LOC107268173 [Cephus cinctus]